jgi:CBS domain-containing protein
MNVRDIMKKEPRTCTPDTTVAEAAHLMWEADCGVLPVVDEGELVGIVTDRDMYIALATKNERAAVLPVGAVATAEVVTCQPDDDVRQALDSMRRARVRRLPVVGPARTVVGILSLNDVILALGNDPTLESAAVVTTLKAICARPADATVVPSTAAVKATRVSANRGRGRNVSSSSGGMPPPARRRKQDSQGRAS